MRTSSFIVPLLAVALLTCGCAVPPPANNPALIDAKLNRLDSDQQNLARRLERLQDNLTLIEARLLDQQQTIDLLRRDAAQKVTSSGQKAASAAVAEGAPAPAGSGSAPGSPTELYLQAFADYASGRFPQAIDGFNAFLRHYPNNDYAGNAQYWLGECYLSRQEYELAVSSFRKTVESYPQGGKTPDALLKMSTALQLMDEPDQAQDALRLLRSRYPDSQAARKSLEPGAQSPN